MIPKIIWQTHELEYEDLFPFQKNIISTWKNLNPDWEHRYISSKEREEYVKSFDTFLYECYLLTNKINQADIFRMIAVYQNGGFYADMDSVCKMPLDDIISKKYTGQEMICTPEGYQINETSINCSNFAGVKNNKILKMVLDETIFQYKNIIAKGFIISDLNPGQPCGHSFSNICVKNKNNICFDGDYLSHGEDYKSIFNPNYEIFYNDKTMWYSNLAKEKQWTIY